MKLTDKIHLLRLDFEISIGPGKKLPRIVNSIVIFGEKITVIDTGVLGSDEIIFNYIEQQDRNISEIETIILSHAHPDHIGGAAMMKAATSCRILAHEQEKIWIEDIEKQYRERPVPGFYNLVDQSVFVDECICEGSIFKADSDVTLKFLHTPGHSKGLLSINFIEDNILFTADAIPLKGDIPNYDNYRALGESLKKIKTNNDYSVLLTSWSTPIFNIIEAYRFIGEGEAYLQQIDSVVKQYYNSHQQETLAECRAAIQHLGLPPFLANPLVDKAFRSHLN